MISAEEARKLANETQNRMTNMVILATVSERIRQAAYAGDYEIRISGGSEFLKESLLNAGFRVKMYLDANHDDWILLVNWEDFRKEASE